MPFMQGVVKECYRDYSSAHEELMVMDTIYNAGILGGTRETVLGALSMIVSYLDITPQDSNCNMPALNFALHRHFFNDVFTGFPLNNPFKQGRTGIKI